jgi:hypothetical protein
MRESVAEKYCSKSKEEQEVCEFPRDYRNAFVTFRMFTIDGRLIAVDYMVSYNLADESRQRFIVGPKYSS